MLERPTSQPSTTDQASILTGDSDHRTRPTLSVMRRQRRVIDPQPRHRPRHTFVQAVSGPTRVSEVANSVRTRWPWVIAHPGGVGGRTACTRPLRCSSVALGHRRAKAPTKGLSTLNSMAFGLAVYASQDGLPRHHARLASGRWSGATGRAFHPQGSYERFQICFLTSHPPFPSFAWHNDRDRCASGFSVRRRGHGHRRELETLISRRGLSNRLRFKKSRTDIGIDDLRALARRKEKW